MRALLVVVALSLAPAVGAQPDPTDPALYAPLGVGSEWRYERGVDDPDGYYVSREFTRHRVTETVSIGGESYVIVLREAALEAVPAWREVGRDTVRFDADRAVVIHLEGGVEVERSCPLDAAFGATVSCAIDGSQTDATVTGSTTTQKAFVVDPAVPYPVYRAGIGLVGFDSATEAPGLDSLPDLYYAEVVGPDGETTEFGYLEDNVPDVVSDPTDPALYYPLHIGFEREDYVSQGGNGAFRRRTEVRRDTTVGGRTYAVEWRATAPTEFAFDPTELPDSVRWGEGAESLLRLDSTARVVKLRDDGSEVPVTPPLDARYGTLVLLGDEPRWGEPLPDGREGDFAVYGRAADVTYPVAGVDLPFEAVKSFEPVPISDLYDGPDPSWTYVAGVGRIGPAYYFSCAPPLCVEWVTYLRTLDADGNVVEAGTPLPTAGGKGPVPTVLAVRVRPNPAAGPLALVLDVPAPAALTLEAFDALGRRVWAREVALAAGRQRIEVDTGGWAPGLYVVRATGEGRRATVTVVRR